MTGKETYDFSKDEIGLDYIFWSTQEPFYSRDAIPFVSKNGDTIVETLTKELGRKPFPSCNMRVNINKDGIRKI